MASPFSQPDATADLAVLLTDAGVQGKSHDVFLFLAEHSPFLRRLIQRQMDLAQRLAAEPPDRLFADVLRQLPPADSDQAKLMRGLRQARAAVALIIGYADVAGLWDVRAVTTALSDFADAALTRSLDHLLAQAVSKRWLAQGTTAAGCGFFILGMGKLGASELNYSSDIDLVLFYEPERVPTLDDHNPRDIYVRLARDLVRILEQRTADGYVFRVDLRLRPDPGSTPPAMSVWAAEHYYQSVALTWERAAMIKARPIAGDGLAADGFLTRMAAFIWRSSVDFTALEDIHAMRDQIHRHHNQREICVEGFNVKLGPGGIREIEFFAQIHQLLLGGRAPSLRVRGTLAALDRLVSDHRITAAIRNDLVAAYTFLRMVEHRLQMIEDEQTQTIPEKTEPLTRLVGFCGFSDIAAFRATLMGHLVRVQAHYAQLLPEEPSQTSEGPALAEVFADPGTAAGVLDAWRRGRYPALKSPRTRKNLEHVLPELLARLKAAADPDRALVRFDTFLQKLPAGAQLFSLFRARPKLMALIVRIMGTAPALADHLARHPHLMEMVLEPDFFDPLPDQPDLLNDLSQTLAFARSYEDVLNTSRRWLNDKRFQTGVHILEAMATPEEAADTLTRLADCLLQALFDAVHIDYAKRYGRFPGAALLGLAMGKYGGRELTFTSDLDLIFVYLNSGVAEQSDGPRQVGDSRYFSGLARGFLTAVTALTHEGRLYEVDTRLRPSGRQGPLAVRLSTLQDYYEREAWLWEHLALVRARPVLGPPDGQALLRQSIEAVLRRPRPEAQTRAAVAAMREKLFDRFGSERVWALKHGRGGLLEIEFLAQTLVLLHAHGHEDVIGPGIADILSAAARHGLIAPADAATLSEAYRLQLNLQGVLRLCVADTVDPQCFSEELRRVLVRSIQARDFNDVEDRLRQAQASVRRLYAQHMQPDDHKGAENG
ncbi:MAG: bifunctional [glutamine synthetase] adenylyltransferase/[glutamine synthetase]-adenylyl-L-tyrosine phosphorylase [Rhodothalassiaceae bacterium]